MYSVAEMAERKPNSTKKQKQVEIHKQRDMCRMESGDWKYGGYRKDILTENLTKRFEVLLICSICEGIMREACLTSNGEQICSCCEVRDPTSTTTKTVSTLLRRKYAKRPSKQTPNIPVRKMVDSLKCSCPLLERGCKWLGTLKECEEHLDTCGHIRDQCKLKCGAVLQRNELRVHEEVGCPLCIVKCKHCKGDLKLGDMPTHLEVCQKMEVPCKMACGVVLCRSKMTQHLMEECGLMVVTCELGCGMMTRDELKIHVTDTCVQRMIQCDHCQRDVKFCDMPDHLDVCPKMKVSCELACNVVMCREDMAQHLKQECGLMEETCKLGCDMKMTRNEIKKHLTDTCVQRLIQCEHCQRDVKFCDMSNHLEVCPQMEVSCELKCNKIMPRQDMAQHLEQECGFVVEACKRGCGMEMTRNELKFHVTEACEKRLIQCEYCNSGIEFCDMPNHLDVCPKMEVSCELACGVIMCREDSNNHLNEFCPERELACPFVKYKCEVGLLKRKYFSKHLEEKRTEHLELKLNAMEEIILKQSEESKQHREESKQHREESKQHREESKQHRDEIKHLKLKLTRLENIFTPITTKCQEEVTKQMITIKVNKLSQQINTLCSINNTTKLEWKIEDITELIKTVHQPQKRKILNGVILNIYFLKNSICVSFDHEHGIHQTTVVAKFMISLYSNTEQKVMKHYKHDISQFLAGDVKREIARIPNFDIQELSRIGATDIILEMYITVM